MNSIYNSMSSSIHKFNPYSTQRNFLHHEEYQDLKARGEALEEKLKFRREFEIRYMQSKLEELDQDYECTKLKNQVASKRNEELLNSIQKDIYKCYEVSKVTSHSKGLLDKEKKRYADYLSYQLGGIKNEFQLKLLAKQNELNGIKTILENQYNHNADVYKMENEYSIKMAKMNQELAEKIKILHLKNKKIEAERQNLLKNYENIEEKTREALGRIFDDNKYGGGDENQNEGTKNKLDENKIEEMVKKLLDKSSNPQENKTKSPDKPNNTNNTRIKKEKPLGHTPGKLDEIMHQRHEKEKLKSSGMTMSVVNKNNMQQNSSYSDLQKNNPKAISQKITLTNQNLQNLQNLSHDTAVNKNKPSLNQSIPGEDTNIGIKAILKNYIQEGDKNSNKNPEEKPLQNLEDKNLIKIENPNIKINQNPNSEDPKTDNYFEQEPQITLKKADTMKKKSSLERLLEAKPELTEISKEIKMQVLKKVIIQIEKNSKSIKPGNPSSYIYQNKHMNISANKDSIKNKFYELLAAFNTSENTAENSMSVLSSTSTDLLIMIILEILNSNNTFNIYPETIISKEFNEQMLDSDIDPNIKEIFDLIIDHVKKIVLERKTSPNIAANILANTFINFEKDQRMTSNLVAILERKLSQKAKPTTLGMMGSSFGGGFNSKFIF